MAAVVVVIVAFHYCLGPFIKLSSTYSLPPSFQEKWESACRGWFLSLSQFHLLFLLFSSNRRTLINSCLFQVKYEDSWFSRDSIGCHLARQSWVRKRERGKGWEERAYSSSLQMEQVPAGTHSQRKKTISFYFCVFAFWVSLLLIVLMSHYFPLKKDNVETTGLS